MAKQERKARPWKKPRKSRPKLKEWFDASTIIAGDFHIIKKYCPNDLSNKIIVTNTTTNQDVKFLKNSGAAYLFTSTPRLDNRTFGTNVIEAIARSFIDDIDIPHIYDIESFLKHSKFKHFSIKLNEIKG